MVMQAIITIFFILSFHYTLDAAKVKTFLETSNKSAKTCRGGTTARRMKYQRKCEFGGKNIKSCGFCRNVWQIELNCLFLQQI
jgi:hypothetical protein